MSPYQVVTPWWARWPVRLGEALIALGERGRRLQPVSNEEPQT